MTLNTFIDNVHLSLILRVPNFDATQKFDSENLFDMLCFKTGYSTNNQDNFIGLKSL